MSGFVLGALVLAVSFAAILTVGLLVLAAISALQWVADRIVERWWRA